MKGGCVWSITSSLGSTANLVKGVAYETAQRVSEDDRSMRQRHRGGVRLTPRLG